METDLKSIFSRFRGEGTFLEGKSFGPGHIHDTFRIITAEPECDNYIIQRLNSNVFRDIPNLQENMERVTGHLRNKIAAMPGSDPKRECLTLVPDRETGRSFITDADGRYWRMFVFIEDHRSYEKVDSAHKAFEGGRIIGRFQAMLADLPGEPLHETIPDFHNIARRLDAFHRVISRDPAGRVAAVRSEIEEITSREEEMKTIIRLGAAGKIPLRITHNDTKFNNILFDKNDRALLIIDLDTVMPGYIHCITTSEMPSAQPPTGQRKTLKTCQPSRWISISTRHTPKASFRKQGIRSMPLRSSTSPSRQSCLLT